jgi:hypothetical protein
MASDYAGYVSERYQGEVYGEAVFRALADHARDETLKAKLRVLEQLERETKDLLRAEVAALGLDTRESAERWAEGEALAARLRDLPWAVFMKGFLAEVRKLVAAFEESERLAPPGKEPLLRHVTAHERALGEFAELELGGATNSLAPVKALLKEAPAARRGD